MELRGWDGRRNNRLVLFRMDYRSDSVFYVGISSSSSSIYRSGMGRGWQAASGRRIRGSGLGLTKWMDRLLRWLNR